MIIKATLATLVIILVVVIATSYYVNKEGFDDITNNLGGALNTDTADTSVLDTTQLLVGKPLLTTPPPRLSTGMSGSGKVGSGMSSSGTVGNGMSSSDLLESDRMPAGTVFTPPLSPAVLPSIQEARVTRANRIQMIEDDIYSDPNIASLALKNMQRLPVGPEPSVPISTNPLEHKYNTTANMFDLLNVKVREDINSIAKAVDDIIKGESSCTTRNSTELIKTLNDMKKNSNDILNKIAPRGLNPIPQPNIPDINLLLRYTVAKAAVEVNRVINILKIREEMAKIIADPNTTKNKVKALENLTFAKESLNSYVNNMNTSINKMNATKFVEPNNNTTTTSSSSTTTSATNPAATNPAATNPAATNPAAATPATATTPAVPPSTTGSSPTRTDVVPEVKFSEDGYNALMLQQKADILKDLQKVVRNEVLANRSTTPMLHNDSCGGGAEDDHKDDKNGCEHVKEPGCGDNTWVNECGKKSLKDKVTAAISQGKEYENSCYKDKKSAGASCPPQADMAQFIKKDAIPCWGCNLDY